MAVRITIIWLAAFSVLSSYGQGIRNSSKIAEIISRISEEAGAENITLLTEMLLDLANDPVMINQGDSAAISRLFFLTPFQAEILESHIRMTGPILSFAELASLKGFSRETAEMMMPFIRFDVQDVRPGTHGRHKYNITMLHSAAIKMDNRQMVPINRPFSNSLRYRLRTGNLTAALTAASEPGEYPLWSGQPDFVSGGIAITGKGRVRNMIIGDYSARFGLGLTTNSGYKPFLTLTETSYMGNRDGYSLYTSLNEDNYLRGAAATFSTAGVSLSAFISSRYRDARVNTDSVSDGTATILASAPVHGSLSGHTAGGLLRETSGGMSIGLGKGSVRWALNACFTSFSHTIQGHQDNYVRELYDFNGKHSFNAGISYRMSYGRLSGAGEASVSKTGRIATALTMNYRPDDRFTLNMIYRNYDKAWYGHLSGGPGRNSKTTNEEGLMIRATLEAARGLFIDAGVDNYRFPWLKQRVSYPSAGNRSELRIRYEADTSVHAELRIYSSRNQINSTSQGIAGAAVAGQTTSRLRLSVFPSHTLNIAVNAFYKHNSNGNKGYMMTGETGLTPSNLPVGIWLRYALFTTTGFDTGLYLYENDMLYGFSIPVHYGTGSRVAAVCTLKIRNNTEIRLKYASSSRTEGNKLPVHEELKMQVRLIF